MRPVAGPVALAFAFSLAVLIGLAGPLLLFNPTFVSWLQERHDVAEVGFDGQREVVARITAAYIGDLWTDGDFRASANGGDPFLDDRERSHMSDVSRLVRLLGAITLLAGLTGLLSGWMLRRERQRAGRLMFLASATVGAIGLLLAIVFAVSFDAAFLAFHALLFPPDTYLFVPGSPLLRLFPGSFWFEASLVAGGVIVLTASLVALGGWRLTRDSRAA